MTLKFDVGDRVRVKDVDLACATVAGNGAEAIVTGYVFHNQTTFLSIKWDKTKRFHRQSDGGYYEAGFELVDETPFIQTEVVTTKTLKVGSFENFDIRVGFSTPYMLEISRRIDKNYIEALIKDLEKIKEVL